MLNHFLAGIVALGSLVLFLSGFFFPEVQRKPDLAWSGVALLYALLLFAEGDRTSGGAVLGHMASVALILWFGWQTLQQRRQFATAEDQTAIPNSMEALTPFVKEGWGRIMVAYGEASSWVQEQLGNDDTSIAPQAVTQQSQDWDEPSTASEPDDVVITVPPEPTLELDEAAVAVEPEPEHELTTSTEADLIPTVTAEAEPSMESPAPSNSQEASESLADSSEPESSSGESESPVVSDEESEIEVVNAAIANSSTVVAHQESAPQPESIPSVPEQFEPSAVETEPTLPLIKTVTEAEDSTPVETPTSSTHVEDDGTWPPHPIDE